MIPNITPDTYTVEVSMQGFKTLKRTGVSVSGGDRVAVGGLVIEVGGASETVDVTAEAPLIQASSGERSFTVTTESVENLPLSNRNFASLTQLTPGVTGTTTRLGGGGQNNIMMDGVSTMDTGNNGQMLQMNVEAIAEVKVLTSGYQAEYGRSSGLQITAVTKSGTNRLRGSLYDVERNSDWNENSWVNVKNGLPKTIQKERDWGYSLSGPVGKPGGSNKLFFFYSHEYRPRESGRQVNRFRVPTARRARRQLLAVHRSERQPDSEPGRFQRRQRRRLSRQGDPGRPPVSAGPGDPESLAPAEYHRAQLQLRGRTADGEHADPAARRQARLSAAFGMAHHRQIRRADAQPRSEFDRRRGGARHHRPHPGVQRLRRAVSVDRHDLGDQQPDAQFDDVPRGDLRLGAEPARLDDHHARLEPLQRRPRRPAPAVPGRRA